MLIDIKAVIVLIYMSMGKHIMCRNENDILVTVLCLTYNHEKYIRQALEGFVSQKTSYPFEIVVHDDASTDNTVTIIKEYEKNYPNLIKAIYQTQNLYSQGISCTKYCIERFCQGKYIALCEGDDFWTDCNKLETQISFMEKHPECTMTYHPVNYIMDEKIIGTDSNGNKLKEVSVDELIYGGGTFCATLSLIFRKSVGLENPKFRQMADVGDYPLQILTGLRGKVFYFPQVMGCYRKNHAGSWTSNLKKNHQKAVQHWNTEIAWLKELNNETDEKYFDAIFYRIAYCQVYLYELGYIQSIDVEKTIGFIKNVKDKSELTKVMKRKKLKRNIPFLAKFYNKAKDLFLN